MKVLLTRPRRDAEALAQRLAGRKAADGTPIEPIVFPALGIVPQTDPAALAALDAALARLESYQLVVFVSPNAIDHALARLARPWPATVPVGVVGPGSVAALKAHGIAPPAYTVHAPGGLGSVTPPSTAQPDARYDSEALFATLDPAHLAGARVLIVKGNGGRPWLAEQLAAVGAGVDLVEAYRREAPGPDPAARAAVAALIAGNTPAAVVVTSSEGLVHLRGLVAAIGEQGGSGGQGGAGDESAAGHAWLTRCTLFVPHVRIAENATAAGLTRMVPTGAGDENIIRTLESEPLRP